MLTSNAPIEINPVDSNQEIWQAKDGAPLIRANAVDIGYPRFPERLC
jgi:hypothetical protein